MPYSGEMQLNWPEKTLRFLNVAGILDFDVDILSLNCVTNWSWKQDFYMQLGLPLMIAL